MSLFKEFKAQGLISLLTGKKKKETKVFLGGTCNGSKWRDQLIPLLTCNYFNPVVENWTPEDLEIEHDEKQSATDVLYVITPKHVGFYTFAELIESKHNSQGQQTILMILDEDEGEKFTLDQMRSISAIRTLFLEGGKNVSLFSDFKTLAAYLNDDLF